VYLSILVKPKHATANIPIVCTNISDGFMSPCENELANNVTFKKMTHINPATRFEDALILGRRLNRSVHNLSLF
jgi:hypothetical protein